MAQSFTLFNTPIGRCGVLWNERGILALQLPEANERKTRARLLREFPDACEAEPSPEVKGALSHIAALMNGEVSDLSGIALDMERVPPFHRRVYDIARAIPPGATLSYGEIAHKFGMPGAARAVGQALGRNPFPIVVPCHRVLAANGKLGGFSANGGVATKMRLLSMEGARVTHQLALFEGDGTLGFDPIVAIEHLRAADPVLGRWIDEMGPFRMQITHTNTLFLSLARAIVYQQLTGKAAATIFARLRALFPHAHDSPTAEQILRTADEKLQSAGLSRSKLLSLKDLARKAVDGVVPTLAEVHPMDNEEIIERLTQVRGIGRWSVEMLLIFRLGRPDVLPLDDLGVRKGFAVTFNKRKLPTREQLAKHGERWKPYCSVASWYLWRAAEKGKS